VSHARCGEAVRRIREAVGEKELSVELPDGASARDLRRRLADRYPVFETFGDRLAVSVQLEVVPLDTARCATGTRWRSCPRSRAARGACWISDRPLGEADAVARVKGPGMGGIVTFVGAVRDHARGRSIRHLEYEAYPGDGRARDGEDRRAGAAALAGHARRDRATARATSRWARSPW
jgi:molybdopterin synthase catalytic subunit